MIENYIMYLRKSRADDTNESVEEVLAKHELMLQNYAKQQFNEEIPEAQIYREVVSGETIADRPQIQKVLHLIEDKNIKGVLVVEPARLTRGDLIDCGTIINSFKYSNTLIITPTKIFDLNKTTGGINYDEKILKMELTNSNEYLEYTKLIMNRGKRLSAEKGNYIGSVSPYGYNRVTKDKSHTLEINEFEAEAVKLIFKLYLDGWGYKSISDELERMGYFPRNAKHWNQRVLHDMLKNEHYIGKIVYYRKKEYKTMENGRMVKKTKKGGEYLIFEGKHEAIIDEETFKLAKEKMDNNPRVNYNKELVNPFAGLLYCKKCGKSIIFRRHGQRCQDRFLCSGQRYCHTKSAIADVLFNNIIEALNNILSDFEIKIQQTYDDQEALYHKRIKDLEKERIKLDKKQDELYDLLENKIYTREVFLKRNAKLQEEIKKLDSMIIQMKQKTFEKIDYQEKATKLSEAIATLQDDTIKAETKNKLLKQIINRIEYNRDIVNDEIHLDVILK